jgi:hypothetical protein
MIHDIEMTCSGIIHMPSFIKICSGIQKLLVGYTCRLTKTDTQAHRQQGDFISLFFIFQHNESSLKIVMLIKIS